MESWRKGEFVIWVTDWVGWTGIQSQMLVGFLKKALFGHLYINVIYF